MLFIPIENDYDIKGGVGDLVAVVGIPWGTPGPFFKTVYDTVPLESDCDGEIYVNLSKISTTLGYFKIKEATVERKNKVWRVINV